MYARVIRKVRRDSGEVVMDTSTTYHCVRATVYEAAAGGTECEIQLFNNDCITEHYDHKMTDVYLMNDKGDTIARY